MKIVGLDIGTTSVCGTLCDSETGEMLRSVTRPNGAFLPAANAWERLQDPKALVGRVREILAELSEGVEVGGVGVTGQMHGIVYVDAEGAPLGPLAIWQDGRGDRPYRDGLTYAQWLRRETGCPLATGYGAVTHFYNTVNGLVPEGAVSFCTIHDLAVMALTGRKTPLVHPSDAASFGLYDLKRDRFDAAAIAKAGMDARMFPEVATGYALAGYAAGGVPVSVAIGDNQASVIGSVADLDGSVLVNVGTGSQISCVVASPPECGDVECRPLVDGRWLLVGSSLCGGRAYAILERFLRETAEAVAGVEVASAYPAMDRVMASFAAPDEPLRVDTAFSGTRAEPSRRGSIGNVGIGNLTMANLCDGVMNGMVDELRALYAKMRPHLKKAPATLVGSGNGVRHNAPLARRFEAAFGLPLRIPANREEAAFGASLFALVACGARESIAAAQKCIRY